MPRRGFNPVPHSQPLKASWSLELVSCLQFPHFALNLFLNEFQKVHLAVGHTDPGFNHKDFGQVDQRNRV